jgi:outer membrane protein assembly factor BamB
VKFRHKIWTIRVILILITLALALSFSCVAGMQPIGWSGAAVSDNALFVGTQEGRLVAVNISDGSRLFSRRIESATSSGGLGCFGPTGGGCAGGPVGAAIYSTPAVSEDSVYIGAYDGRAYAFDYQLRENWKYPPEGEKAIEPIIGSLVVASDTVYFGSSDGKVYALVASTGRLAWNEPFQTGEKIWSTPVISDNRLFIGSFDHKLYALDADDGSLQWEFETEGPIVSRPVVNDGMVFFGSFDRYFYAVNAESGVKNWEFVQADNWFWANPVVYDGVVYAPCLDGKVYVLNAANGEQVVDAIDLGSALTSSPVLVDTSLIIISQKGIVYSLDVITNQVRQLAEIGKLVYAPLVASDSIVYVHPQEPIIQPINLSTGAKLATISLKSSD